ncbi:RNA_pol_Rpb1_2 domain-containing protein/RNA_pol_Rpb1_3 domain-containing protein/RNA_pol_Rpb1_1 domain-containing protein/RNA_pol_Rpb1_5 domain-containing protein/RNA_pol_Rpb1_4 domain-containing protein [Cephalotus follicularis]|uniref:DNA-directed RNA polymerase subunit n=1 Tax=Cephalotus follicularis TaxID=3775 RepID=A0A1Q3BWT2_CEPFO|nr:RNA_pol_Rpb1_2 domain-containing protein/RNA_pol_Rpb1_3 domain-containing protein/RNA_pol_Rpb1_1 domain-containing protein/RNA_pol_Rpb1_5 domain-containing protein/RNA_pol_Rpb1_4 domain-containing protein [Cephalotus follicularis]
MAQAQITEGASESVEAVRFSFLTDDEVEKLSIMQIKCSGLLDLVNNPTEGGLYDPKLGPLDERTPCKTCGQLKLNCHGHFGHIKLVYPAYNPLLFNFLYNLLQRTCFHCCHFRASRDQVRKIVSQLELIAKGDIVGAKSLDSALPSLSSYSEDSDVSHESCSTVHSGEQDHDAKHIDREGRTSLQFSEARSVLTSFLKPRFLKCKNCNKTNPKIRKPTFGWIHKSGLSSVQIRANVITGYKLGEPSDDGVIEDTNDTISWGDDVASAGSHEIKKKNTRSRGRKEEQGPLDFTREKKSFSGSFLPSEVKDIVKELWENEVDLCSFISDIQQQGLGEKAGHSMFFLDTVLVSPIKFRSPTYQDGEVIHHPQTDLLKKLLESNISLGEAVGNAKENKLKYSKIVSRWMALQQSINLLFDSKTAMGQGQRSAIVGICQLLEKKEGVFRQKMMGKRVNFACRSVISPDPYLAVNEIGIPPYFAVRLTYPERVTTSNVVKLRNAIINGPDVHPGATHYVDRLSTTKLTGSRKTRISISRKLPSSRGAVIQPGKSCDNEFEGKIVYRHLQDGDVVLVNRQPTLHKPSIMAHIVRVLKGEKTIRMHYANCSTYNADFDGDEMNVHFPQDEISRAEAYNIVNANNQYVRPSNGDPIRALIQDHIISAVLLTKRDTFLSREEFNQLLYSSGVSNAVLDSFSGKPGKKVFISSSEEETLSVLPAIWKPETLWTGKQVITAVLNHITRGHPPFTVEKGGKLPHDFFRGRSNADRTKNAEQNNTGKFSKSKETNGDKPSKVKAGANNSREEKRNSEDKAERKGPDEEKLLIYENDLVRGVIDKAQFAEYGLVHTVQELYGSNTAGNLLSAFSRLFTVFLQMHAFTCGVDDLLLLKVKDDARKKQLEDCEASGKDAHREFLNLEKGTNIDPTEQKLLIEEAIRSGGESALTSLDRKMTSILNAGTSSGVISELLSQGLLKSTGKNCISLMTTSGAKGSKVNFQQISSHLGQQELEGKRVPRMISGKTLPCFHPWDWASRAGGFITDRFLTGLRPQEYYFHCMAGREGLVDTAVKTSRSGYLQRCLIKNLEGLKVNYDHTVRDSDGSIVQFCYGEDGIDVHQTTFIAKFDALAANKNMINRKYGCQPDTSNSYIKELPDALKDEAEKFMHDFSRKEQNLFKLLNLDVSNLLKLEDFLSLLKHKFLSSLAQPGEPVGVLAAQSVGEPSTQMTLNTFHLAGRGEMNVTLGIPRLQEILMTASQDIKTPVMTCPLHKGKTEEDAKKLADKLKRVTVADIIESMEVCVTQPIHADPHKSVYKLKMKLYKPDHYPKDTDISSEDWRRTLTTVFLRELEDAILNHMILVSKISGIKFFVQDSKPKASNETDDTSGSKAQHGEENGEDDEDNEDAEDLGLDAQKRKQRATDEVDYDEDSEEELNGVLSSAASETETDEGESETEHDGKNETIESQSRMENPSKVKTRDKETKSDVKRRKRREGMVRKDTDRSTIVKYKDQYFEVHFELINEPHILLAQLAQRTANKVHIQSCGKIEQCKVATCKEDQVIYYGKDPKKRKNIKPEEKQKVQALHTTGVDFRALWERQDDLDVRYIYSNSIHAMLNTYGVEAARETIIREITHVFKSYGISVNIRHLTVIADFMTHSGGYRPMNRLGGIAESVSPLSKMSFETASKFIVQAACHGEVDNLETPSARICLGLPVKMGTGSFDLMQKLDNLSTL